MYRVSRIRDTNTDNICISATSNVNKGRITIKNIDANAITVCEHDVTNCIGHDDSMTSGRIRTRNRCTIRINGIIVYVLLVMLLMLLVVGCGGSSADTIGKDTIRN